MFRILKLGLFGSNTFHTFDIWNEISRIVITIWKKVEFTLQLTI